VQTREATDLAVTVAPLEELKPDGNGDEGTIKWGKTVWNRDLLKPLPISPSHEACLGVVDSSDNREG
jgi:hypothetical protein